MRSRYKDSFEKKHGVRLGFMSLFCKACVVALKEFPAVNAEIDGDDIVYKNHYDIGVAVSSPQGLVVPVVRDCEALTMAEIEAKIADFGKRARDGKLTMEELQGGTFTITNGGVYGSLMSTPILNPPQSGILGMHKIQQRPMVLADGRGKAQAAALRGPAPGDPGAAAPRTGARSASGVHAAQGRRGGRGGGRPDPGRRRGHRRHRLGGRVGGHGRVRAGDPRERRRPHRGHRRHAVLSDRIVVRSAWIPGETFLDRMIGLVEGAKRQKTPNEIALARAARRHDDHLPDRLRDAGAVRRLLRPALLRAR